MVTHFCGYLNIVEQVLEKFTLVYITRESWHSFANRISNHGSGRLQWRTHPSWTPRAYSKGAMGKFKGKMKSWNKVAQPITPGHEDQRQGWRQSRAAQALIGQKDAPWEAAVACGQGCASDSLHCQSLVSDACVCMRPSSWLSCVIIHCFFCC